MRLQSSILFFSSSPDSRTTSPLAVSSARRSLLTSLFLRPRSCPKRRLHSSLRPHRTSTARRESAKPRPRAVPGRSSCYAPFQPSAWAKSGFFEACTINTSKATLCRFGSTRIPVRCTIMGFQVLSCEIEELKPQWLDLAIGTLRHPIIAAPPCL